jgi:hypothetical protein
MPPLSWPSWAPWHVAVALAALCLLLFWLARMQVARAREDWANAFFYAPSLKVKHQERRRQWQDISRLLLAAAAVFLVAAVVLYVRLRV